MTKYILMPLLHSTTSDPLKTIVTKAYYDLSVFSNTSLVNNLFLLPLRRKISFINL